MIIGKSEEIGRPRLVNWCPRGSVTVEGTLLDSLVRCLLLENCLTCTCSRMHEVMRLSSGLAMPVNCMVRYPAIQIS
jgi:hypothetical protein